MRYFKLIIISLIMVCSATFSYGQKVGVVLSGGGAKGLYHIGVLQALEENNIPIDYIAGTSMGSIIAGLYAAGYTPEQMKEIASSGVLEKWVSGKIDDSYKWYYSRGDYAQPLLTFNFEVRRRAKQEGDKGNKTEQVAPARTSFFLPPDMISSTQIDLAINELFIQASTACGGDFNNLMIPFFCVSADMVARKAVVMNSGNLGEAIRASMSIPFVFRPLKKGHKLLYDGGVFDNFPWKDMQNLYQPDHIIGVKCTTGNKPVDNKSSLIDQAMMFIMANTDYNLPEQGNIMIDHAVNVGMLDFDKSDYIIQLGYDDTIKRIEEIKATIGIEGDSTTIAKRRADFLSKQVPLKLSTPNIKGVTSHQKHYAKALMQAVPNSVSTTSFEYLKSGIYNMVADNEFFVDFPQLKYNSSIGLFEPTITTHARPSLRVMLGGNLSSTAYNQVRINMVYRYIGKVNTINDISFYLGPIYNAGHFGSRLIVNPKHPIYFDTGFTFAIRNTLAGNYGNLTTIDNTIRKKHKEFYMSAGIGIAPTKRSAFTLNYNLGKNIYRFDDQLPHSSLRYHALKLELKRSSLNDPLWPLKGTYISLSGIYIAGKDRFGLEDNSIKIRTNKDWVGAKLEWKQYIKVSPKWFSLGYLVEGVYTNHPKFTDSRATLISMPQFAPISHSQMIYMPQFHADKYIAAGIAPSFNIASKFSIQAGFYAMYRNDYQDASLKIGNWQYIADLSVVYRTFVGPISLSLTKYGVKNSNNLYLSFNFGYLMFAPKGTYY